VNEDSIDFDRIAWLRTEKAVLGSERSHYKRTAFGDTANGNRWIEDDLNEVQ
jgi:hypothetical protein